MLLALTIGHDCTKFPNRFGILNSTHLHFILAAQFPFGNQDRLPHCPSECNNNLLVLLIQKHVKPKVTEWQS